MLSERCTHLFKVGYWDATANRPAREEYAPGTFAHYDYNEGYRAGFNGLYWDAVRENDLRDAGRLPIKI